MDDPSSGCGTVAHSGDARILRVRGPSRGQASDKGEA